MFNHVSFSVLDLVPIVEGGSVTESLKNTLDLAQHAEKWGYHRFWLAEHHGMPGVASSATSLIIGYVAGGTKTIRVGSGGIMLPNHAPILIAEQFGTLEAMYPGRIDLGLGRAPGSDPITSRAVRRGLSSNGQDFPELLDELRSYFEDPSGARTTGVRAIPGEGLNIPIWLLGSSGFSAQLAAQLGLPFAFASHFAPDYLLPALELYRSNFQPSEALIQPHIMVGVNVICAETDEIAHRLSTSLLQQFFNIVRGRPGRLAPPVESNELNWSIYEKEVIQRMLKYTVIGDQHSVKEKLQWIIEETKADELIVSSAIYDHKARLRSYELLSEIFRNRDK